MCIYMYIGFRPWVYTGLYIAYAYIGLHVWGIFRFLGLLFVRFISKVQGPSPWSGGVLCTWLHYNRSFYIYRAYIYCYRLRSSCLGSFDISG